MIEPAKAQRFDIYLCAPFATGSAPCGGIRSGEPPRRSRRLECLLLMRGNWLGGGRGLGAGQSHEPSAHFIAAASQRVRHLAAVYNVSDGIATHQRSGYKLGCVSPERVLVNKAHGGPVSVFPRAGCLPVKRRPRPVGHRAASKPRRPSHGWLIFQLIRCVIEY